MDMPKGTSRRHQWLAITLVVFAAIAVGALILLAVRQTTQMLAVQQPAQSEPAPKSTETPQFNVEKIVGGLTQPWDIAFLPDGQAILTDKPGTVHTLKDGKAVEIANISDVFNKGEGGLMGLAIDPAFTDNRFIYTCFNKAKTPGNLNAGPQDIRIVRWKVNAEVTALTDRNDIITGLPTPTGGRHSGCRLAFGLDGFLWVGTGDTATANIPQDPKNLGGKILRTDRDGKPAPDNLGGDFDPRIYSYGHRNTQGIAFAPQPIGSVIGYSIEHGPTKDDEINPLVKGNFGWAPTSYDGPRESATPMTDKQKFPDAIDAIWSSGESTVAPSGANFITGQQWKGWDGALVLAMLKGSHLRILRLDESGKITQEEQVLTDHGRLRAVRQAPDGSLYVTTAQMSGENFILRLTVKE